MSNRIINYTAFTILTLLWIGFAALLLVNQELLARIWEIFGGWPLIVKLAAGLLTLPVVLGLWVWHADWPLWLRLVLVAGFAWVTIYTFFPKKTRTKLDLPHLRTDQER